MNSSAPKLPRLKLTSAPMTKVDQLGWAAGLSIKSYGVRIGIRSNDSAVLDRVKQHFPHEWKTASSPIVDRVYSILIGGRGSNARRFNILYGDHLQIERSRDLDALMERFESDLRLHVAELAHHRVFVHAGVVGWRGKAIVIPGRSYSGKSTLVAELVRAGADYYSDEFAVFDSRGRVHPFAKALELRDEGKYEQTKVTVAELGGHSGTKPLPVGLVLLTHFKNGARWRPRQLTPGKGVLELLFNTVSARRNPERAMTTLYQVTAQAALLKGVRGNAADMVPAMLDRVEHPR